MDEVLGMRSRIGFPAAYLSESVGSESTNRSFFADPNKLPVTGVDVTIAKRGNDEAIRLVAPIYDGKSTDSKTILARNGYGVGAINVHVKDNVPGTQHIVGLQFVFMKVTDKGFDTSDQYSSDWVGEKPLSGNGISIGPGDGRPVYGFWLRPGLTLNSIGLIVEADYKL